MYKINYLLFLLLIIAASNQSCEKFLEEDLISDVSASTYYTTAQGFEDAVNSTYWWSKPFFGPERGWSMSVFGTDLHTEGADGSHKTFNRYDGGLNPQQGFVTAAWRDFYRGINQANAVINRSQDLNIPEAQKTQRIAEVRFLRAFYYFMVTAHYGDAHLTLEETEGVEIEANRTPVAQIYEEAIIPDLRFAISTLPESQNDFGRATKPAAEFLLGKALLRRGWKTGNTADFSEAESLFSSVINNYGFSLLPEFSDLWVIGNEQHPEIIWTIQNSKSQVDEDLDPEGHRGHLYFLMEYDVRPGMTRDVANGRPWKRFRPTDYTLDLWNRDVDSRYDKSYKHVWFSNNEGTIPTDAAGNPKFAVGDTALFIPGPQREDVWTDEAIANARYTVYVKRIDYNFESVTHLRVFPSMNKWIDDTRPDRQKTQGQRDYVFMRLGEAFLLRAEARFKQGNMDGAAADINMIRRRAAWPGQEAAMEITGADVNLDFILDERGRELVGEGHRWMDLTRTNTLVERVRKYNPVGGLNIQDFHVVRPIPQDQIDRTQGGYPQNPGYN